MNEEREPHRRRIPSHLLGGRMRTTTFALCSLWVGMWVLYLFLNQPEDTPAAPSSAVIISETPYVPYVPPAATVPPQKSTPETTDTPYPSTTSSTFPPTTSTSVPGSPQGVLPPQAPTTTAPPTTTTRQLPFDLPRIPGLNEEQGRTVPENTDSPSP
ncbi:hypothetical protein [Rhodococcus sp. R1101]|uniref:hypothetical protein n=1 Tax=Rhodococcus sp. R1101 TaxID=1170698 RepID=UPI0002F7D0C6|nr:hypothetical protein [Rhodococcus sp. R1101]